VAEYNPNPTLLGRLYLLLRAALRQPIICADDAVLPDELAGLRKGNSKLVGVAFALAHRKGWIQPAAAPIGNRLSKKSARNRRSCGSVELWCRTEMTADAFGKVERLLVNRPQPRDLFDDLD
jgi:hypothetical protein